MTDTSGQTQRVAVVTGRARGIGRAIADRFAIDKYRVVVLDIAEIDGPHESMSVDVSDASAVDGAVERTVATHGRLDVMVCNAGIGGGAPVVDLTDDLLRRIIDVNLFGVFACCRAAARAMIPQRSGVIITIGSIFRQDRRPGPPRAGRSRRGCRAHQIAGAGTRPTGSGQLHQSRSHPDRDVRVGAPATCDRDRSDCRRGDRTRAGTDSARLPLEPRITSPAWRRSGVRRRGVRNGTADQR